MAALMPADPNAEQSAFFYAPLAPLDIPDPEDVEGFQPEIILPSILDSIPANTQKAATVLATAALLDTTPPLPAPVAADGEQAEEFISLGDVQRSPSKESPSKQSLQDQPAEEDGPATADGALPWAKSSSRIRAPLLRLHNEIVQFCRALTPTTEEFAARSAAIARVGAVIQATWPSAEVQVFGSFLTGLFLPTSDLDLVIMNSGCRDVAGGLRALATGLTRRGMAKNMQVIAKAKVPIIKFEDPETSFNFDISFDVANGPVAAEYVSTLMHQLPAMRPLVLVLKIFLQQREFNEVYTGGIGSYALLMMVAASLLLHQRRQDDSDAGEASLGVLLLDFFRMYGRALNVEKVGISVRDGGRFFAKASKPDPFLQPDRPYFLAVEDPKDRDNDLCKGSYQILKIRQAFDYAYQQLAAPARRSESILQRIIRTDSVLMGRTPVAEDSEPPLYSTTGQGVSAAASLHSHPHSPPGTSGRSQAGQIDPDERWVPSADAQDDAEEDYMNDSFVQQPAEAGRGLKRHKHRHKDKDRDGDGNQHRSEKKERDRSKSVHKDKKRKSEGDDPSGHRHEHKPKRKREREQSFT